MRPPWPLAFNCCQHITISNELCFQTEPFLEWKKRANTGEQQCLLLLLWRNTKYQHAHHGLMLIFRCSAGRRFRLCILTGVKECLFLGIDGVEKKAWLMGKVQVAVKQKQKKTLRMKESPEDKTHQCKIFDQNLKKAVWSLFYGTKLKLIYICTNPDCCRN